MARTDLEEAFIELGKLLKVSMPEAVIGAQKAVAEVYVQAAKQAAPVKTGQLRDSIKVVEGRPRSDGTQPVYIGPEKKKGYYGYFREKGHRSHIRRINGKIHSKRIARNGNKTTHSQSGEFAPTHEQPPKPWFKPAMKSVEKEAEQVLEKEFFRIMNQKGL